MSAPVEKHPFRAAWETRDGAAWREALAPDVRVNSPIIENPFVGREAVAELYEVLFDALGPVTITNELPAEDGTTVFFWRADLDGRTIEGSDVVRRASDGSVAEITVFIRPARKDPRRSAADPLCATRALPFRRRSRGDGPDPPVGDAVA